MFSTRQQQHTRISVHWMLRSVGRAPVLPWPSAQGATLDQVLREHCEVNCEVLRKHFPTALCEILDLVLIRDVKDLEDQVDLVLGQRRGCLRVSPFHHHLG